MPDADPALPDSLTAGVDAWFERQSEPDAYAAEIAADPAFLPTLTRVVACSTYVADILERQPDTLTALAASGRLARPSDDDEIHGVFAALLDDDPGEAAFERALRWARHRELVRIVWRDLAGLAPAEETLNELSAVADAAINAAVGWSRQQLTARFGTPLNAAGDVAEFVVFAMGKLGGRELNFSSDVDLVFGFTEHGETDGSQVRSNEEYFRALGKRVIGVLSKNTVDGFVYRVDIRLRPFGDSGPLAVSLPALESYLAQHGRDWERYAWVKARVLNGWRGATGFFRDVVRPFVYRRYLDFGVFSALRDMKLMIEAEVQRKEFQDNIKLGRGGIREIEFIVQTLQLVRGGNLPSLRERRLLRALDALVEADCLPGDSADELRAAYIFLRRFENRLQAIADRQTHDIPGDATDRARLALAMGEPDWAGLAERLAGHRDTVAGHFGNIVLHSDESPDEDRFDDEVTRILATETPAEDIERLLEKLGYDEPCETREKLQAFRDSGFYLRLDEAGRQRLDLLLPDVVSEAANRGEPLVALQGVLTIIEAIGRRSAYFSLLNENPGALTRLVDLCSMSGMLVKQIAAHPLLLDELLDQRVILDPPVRADFEADLESRLGPEILSDPEACRFALKNFQQAATFRVAVTDLSGALPLMKVSDRLTDIAELVLNGALRLARHELAERHGRPTCVVDGERREAQFSIVAYGKLGGLELGYGSDLDIIFLHDSHGDEQQTDGEKELDNSVYFIRLAQRVIHILTMRTSSGPMYEVDTRLRPNGKAGLLVSGLAAFEHYQQTEAWTWEHQALLRGRPVAGDAELGAEFAAVRRRILAECVHRDTLREDVLGMRAKMRDALNRGDADSFDLKQDTGAVTDIEFIVQYLVLREAHRIPALTEWPDNIRQLEALGKAGILSPDEAETLASVYRNLRSRMHRLALAEQPRLTDRADVTAMAESVRDIWQRVFGQD